ncbi:O-antigen ligase family protein [Domibacillus sp. DTU_2020_1001157_1_SI_ALB_TIR_016]|uniref:O-antigen ligase family protein n=1 Tax=Domibacillus sp. DTU_2020_1001157_1_SI_ALB_TIR_016 TaxID=3077789 RepID=UPI0028E536F4|nr:O-antigen ligase family protein [Domibacillus sp. DTU_2020_1001157_1_SI_ALB_TIR_016]WNS81187.1 O-antigen ligase family protein [Domibacillus sp. DTU_2020_1001157_1_SI_ALB_TIR_016]
MLILIKMILPIVMVIFFIIYYMKNKVYTKNLEFFTFVFIAVAPYMSSNFSLPFYRPLLQVIAIIGFIKLIIIFLNKKKHLLINKYEFIFLIVIIISGINASYNNSFFSGIINYIYILIVLVLVRSNVNSENIKSCFASIIINGILLSVLSCLEFIILNERTEVVFSNSNYLGFYLVFSSIVYLYLFKSTLYNYKTLFVLVIFTLGILATGSDSVIIAFITAILIGLKIDIKKLFKLIPIGVIGVIIFFFLTKGYLLHQVAEYLSDSNAQRIGIWSIAIDGFLDNPFIGVGYNNFPNYFMDNKYNYVDYSFLSAFFQYDYLVTHNDFIRILTETGGIGFLLFMFYVKELIKITIRINQVNVRKMCLALIFTVIIFISTHNNINAFDTWWILGLPLFFTKNNILIKVK